MPSRNACPHWLWVPRSLWHGLPTSPTVPLLRPTVSPAFCKSVVAAVTKGGLPSVGFVPQSACGKLTSMNAPEKYLRPEVIRQVARLDLRAKFIVEGFLSGLHAS